MSGGPEPLSLFFGIALGFLIGVAMTSVWFHNQDQAPTTCPALGVVTINDAIVIVRECEDGRIIRDYPWEE